MTLQGGCDAIHILPIPKIIHPITHVITPTIPPLYQSNGMITALDWVFLFLAIDSKLHHQSIRNLPTGQAGNPTPFAKSLKMNMQKQLSWIRRWWYETIYGCQQVNWATGSINPRSKTSTERWCFQWLLWQTVQLGLEYSTQPSAKLSHLCCGH